MNIIKEIYLTYLVVSKMTDQVRTGRSKDEKMVTKTKDNEKSLGTENKEQSRKRSKTKKELKEKEKEGEKKEKGTQDVTDEGWEEVREEKEFISNTEIKRENIQEMDRSWEDRQARYKFEEQPLVSDQYLSYKPPEEFSQTKSIVEKRESVLGNEEEVNSEEEFTEFSRQNTFEVGDRKMLKRSFATKLNKRQKTSRKLEMTSTKDDQQINFPDENTGKEESKIIVQDGNKSKILAENRSHIFLRIFYIFLDFSLF